MNNKTGGSANDKTLLDYFAGQTLPELIPVYRGAVDCAQAAYKYAAAMIAEKRRVEASDEQ